MPRPSKTPQEEFIDKLPPFSAKRSESFPAFLIVECGYDDCPGTAAGRPFLVAEEAWMKPQVLERVSPTGKPIRITGRSCPYCFRTGRLPARRAVR